jgi:hypothetical protein
MKTSKTQSYESIVRLMGLTDSPEATARPLLFSGPFEQALRSKAVATSKVDVFIESPEIDTTQESSFVIETPSPRTRISVRSHIVGTASSPSPSPAYLAAKRREKCRKISKAISGLDRYEGREDFHIWTDEPLTLVKNLIHFLDAAEQYSDIESEGNACEVLRQLRDSFLRQGFQRYREKQVRDAVLAILKQLEVSDSITAEIADKSMDQFLDIGLEPVLAEPLDDEQE